MSFRKEDANAPTKVKKSVRFRNALAKSKLDDLSFDEEEDDEESGEEEPMEGEVEEGEESRLFAGGQLVDNGDSEAHERFGEIDHLLTFEVDG